MLNESITGTLERGCGGRCPVCGSALGTNLTHCPRCDALYHAECWAYVGKCAVFGCEPDPEASGRWGGAESDRPLLARLSSLWDRGRRHPQRLAMALAAGLTLGWGSSVMGLTITMLPPGLVAGATLFVLLTILAAQRRSARTPGVGSAGMAALITLVALAEVPLPQLWVFTVLVLAPTAFFFLVLGVWYRNAPLAHLLIGIALVASAVTIPPSRIAMTYRLPRKPGWVAFVHSPTAHAVVLEGAEVLQAWQVGLFLDDVAIAIARRTLQTPNGMPFPLEAALEMALPQGFTPSGTRCLARFALVQGWSLQTLSRAQLDVLMQTIGPDGDCTIRSTPSHRERLVIIPVGDHLSSRVSDVTQSDDTVTIQVEVSPRAQFGLGWHRAARTGSGVTHVEVVGLGPSPRRVVVEYTGEGAGVVGARISLWLNGLNANDPTLTSTDAAPLNPSHAQLLDWLACQAQDIQSLGANGPSSPWTRSAPIHAGQD